MTFEEKLTKAAEVIKTEKIAFKTLISYMVSMKLALAEAQTLEGDVERNPARELASEVAPIASLAEVKTWTVGMTTDSGDIVLDPLGEHKYIYYGPSGVSHTDPMLYPGSSGADYWAIVPEVKDFIKVYPNVDGVMVAVKNGETWWNIDKTQVFKWKGQDNSNCSMSPAEDSEWEAVQPEAE